LLLVLDYPIEQFSILLTVVDSEDNVKVSFYGLFLPVDVYYVDAFE